MPVPQYIQEDFVHLWSRKIDFGLFVLCHRNTSREKIEYLVYSTLKYLH